MGPGLNPENVVEATGTRKETKFILYNKKRSVETSLFMKLNTTTLNKNSRGKTDRNYLQSEH